MKHFLNTFLLTFAAYILMIGGSGCKQDNSQEGKASTLKNISYGSASEGQEMDIYLPANRSTSTTPAIVLMHGGAWISGDKAEFNEIVAALQKQLGEYAFFNINYRLLGLDGSNAWPAQLEDIEAAVDFIAGQAETYRFNAGKLVIIGASAGAHLGLLKALAHNEDGRIKAVIDLFGPTDIKDLYNNPPDPSLPAVLNFFLNGTPDSKPAVYEAASPLYQVTPDAPPTLIFHGTADPLVPIKQSDSLYKRLQAAGVPSDFIVYQGEGHGWAGSNLVDTYARTINFIRQHVQ